MRGLVRQNPVFVLLVGLCPGLAVTNQLVNVLALGAGLLLVLLGSNLMASLLRETLTERARSVVYIVITALLTTAVDQAMRSLFPELSRNLGIYLPLIAASALISGQAAEAARGGSPGRALLDALGMGLGFTLALALVALLREGLGSGTITLFPIAGWSGVVRIPGLSEAPIRLMALSAGALLLFGFLKALFAWFALRRGGEGA